MSEWTPRRKWARMTFHKMVINKCSECGKEFETLSKLKPEDCFCSDYCKYIAPKERTDAKV